LLKALWPFAVGCAFGTFAGAAGYFDYCYAQASRPSPETLHNFMDLKSRTWPARSNQPWKLAASRNAVISFGVVSVLFFLYGVYRVFHAALP
jgi:hypothetical protein